jgi:hypothetical protein
MYIIDPITKNIEVTRGDVLPLTISTLNEDKSKYVFQKDDVVRIKVFKARDCGCVEIQKEVKVEEPTEEVEITLTREETKIGDLIKKPVDYWYEVELNPDTYPQTIIGYEKDKGAKLFTLLPEGGDK